MAHSSNTDNPHTAAIASFVSGFRYERIPADVLARIKLLVLDSLGCAIYGADLMWSRILRETDPAAVLVERPVLDRVIQHVAGITWVVWQVPHGCPVCRAKLGSACAGRVKPVATNAARTTVKPNTVIEPSCPTARRRHPRSRPIAMHP